MKKLIAVLLAVMMVMTMAACVATKDDGTYVVGVCQIAPHAALDAATNGFKDALAEALGDKVTVQVKDAGGEYNNCATIIDGFVAALHAGRAVCLRKDARRDAGVAGELGQHRVGGVRAAEGDA